MKNFNLANLAAELGAFDGKHTEPLERVAAAMTPTPAAVNKLIAVSDSDDVRLQTAGTWVLKRLQENGAAFSAEHVQKLCKLLGTVTHWEARLHLLQMLPAWTIPTNQHQPLFRLLREGVADGNKLVRAWAYNGLVHIASQQPSLQNEVRPLLRRGETDEAASVRARIRNIRKSATWLRAQVEPRESK